MARTASAPKSTSKNIKKSPVAQKMPQGVKILLIVVAVVFVLAVVFSIIAAAFAGAYFKQLIGGGIVKVDQNGTVEVKTKDGKASFSSKAELPANFPVDIPQYPGATVVYSFSGSSQDQVVNVTYSSPDAAKKIVEYYTANLATQGWTPIEESGFFTLGSYGSAKKSNRRLSVVINEETKEGKMTSSIVIGETTTASSSPAAGQ